MASQLALALQVLKVKVAAVTVRAKVAVKAICLLQITPSWLDAVKVHPGVTLVVSQEAMHDAGVHQISNHVITNHEEVQVRRVGRGQGAIAREAVAIPEGATVAVSRMMGGKTQRHHHLQRGLTET
jgi:hypothetical protein